MQCIQLHINAWLKRYVTTLVLEHTLAILWNDRGALSCCSSVDGAVVSGAYLLLLTASIVYESLILHTYFGAAV